MIISITIWMKKLNKNLKICRLNRIVILIRNGFNYYLTNFSVPHLGKLVTITHVHDLDKPVLSLTIRCIIMLQSIADL